MKFLVGADALRTACYEREIYKRLCAIRKAEKIKMAKSRRRPFALEAEEAAKYPFRTERRSRYLRLSGCRRQSRHSRHLRTELRARS